MIWAMMMVKKMRSSTAAPAPRRMPQKRCCGGSERQASAMTTALSPERRMLIQMIWPTASQNAGCIMSAHMIAHRALPYVAPIRSRAADLSPPHRPPATQTTATYRPAARRAPPQVTV